VCLDAAGCGACPVGSAGGGGDGALCVACDALQAPAVQLAFASPMLRSTAAAFHGAAALPAAPPGYGACALGAGFSYAWALHDGAGAPVVTTGATATLSLPAASLAVGAAASVSLTVCWASAPLLPCATSAVIPFAVVASPLSARISGGGAQLSAGTAAALDGGLSRDPDVASAAGLTYAWACADAAGGACAGADGAPLQLPASAATLPLQQLRGAPTPGATYTLTLTVSKDSRAANASTTVTVVDAGGAPFPIVSIAALPQPEVDASSSRVVLSAAVTPAAPGDAVTQRWSVSPLSSVTLNLTSPEVSSTPLTLSSLVLLPGALPPGATLTLRLTATSANAAAGTSATSFADVAVATMAAFTPGTLSVSWPGAPAAAAALTTPLTLTALGWGAPGGDAAHLPLQYSFAYAPAGGGGGDAATVTALTSFSPAPSATVLLPAGSWALLVRVRSALGATVPAAMALAAARQVEVAMPSGPETAFAGPLLADAAAAAAAGRTDAVLQLAGGLASVFNAAPSADDARLQLRASLLDSVRASLAAAPPASPAALQALAGALQALTSAPAELSPAARTSAVASMGAIAASGAAVSGATAAAVLNCLSNVTASSLGSVGASASGSNSSVRSHTQG
jgi:hypothetical protein